MKNKLTRTNRKEIMRNFKSLKQRGNTTFQTMRQTSFAHKIEDIVFFNSFKSVLILMALVVIYYAFIAANRYVSESIITVKSSGTDSSITITGLSSLLGNSATGSQEDVNYLKTYIVSPDMLRVLEKEIDIRKIYAEQKLDFIFSISEDADEDKFFKYYEQRVKISDVNGLLKVEVEGFTPEQAHLISTAILKESERFVNELSYRSAREQLQFAENELLKYKEKYQEASNKLIEFQNKHGVFDPLKEAQSRASFIAQMEGNLAQKEAELTTMQSYIQDNAPQLSILKAEIAAIKAQLEKEKSLIASSKGDQKLNNLAADFQELSIEAGFAENAYTTALKAYETTRIDTIRKLKYLVVVQAPTTPQSAMYPRSLYNIATIFIILTLAFGIIKLIKTIIEEHRY